MLAKLNFNTTFFSTNLIFNTEANVPAGKL
jgi:hypothetical protein